MRRSDRRPRAELVSLVAVAAVRVVAARRARRNPAAASGAPISPAEPANSPTPVRSPGPNPATWAWRSVSALGVVLVVVGSLAVGSAWSSGPDSTLPVPDPTPADAARAAATVDTRAEDPDVSAERRSATTRGSGVPVPPPVTRGAQLDDRVRSEPIPPVAITSSSGSVQGRVTQVGVDELGGVEVPPNADDVGWYRHGPAPGAPGSAVLVGHVDFDGRPGPFYELRGLAVGEILTVGYADGTERRFRVIDRRQFPKGDLTSSGVFDTTADPRLVLVTCGGSFDRSQRSYLDNIAVTAVPV